MGTPSVTWDAAYENTPAGGDDPRAADDRMREMKLADRERAEREHGWAVGEASARHGVHRKGSARTSYATGDPTTVPDGTSTRALNSTDDDGRLHVDATSKKLRVYDGSAWQDTQHGIMDSGTTHYNLKVINIGDWNMDATVTINVAHGLTLSKITGYSVTIRDDSGATRPLNFAYPIAGPVVVLGGSIKVDATNFILDRGESTSPYSSHFDSVLYDSTSYNRGWIMIWYTD